MWRDVCLGSVSNVFLSLARILFVCHPPAELVDLCDVKLAFPHRLHSNVTSGVQFLLRPRWTWRWTGSHGFRHPGIAVEMLHWGPGNTILKLWKSHVGEKLVLFAKKKRTVSSTVLWASTSWSRCHGNAWRLYVSTEVCLFYLSRSLSSLFWNLFEPSV